MVGLLGYAVVHSAADALFTPAYIRSKIVGTQITELVRNAPAPIYRIDWMTGLNELAYVPRRITTIDPSAIPTVATPAWIVVSPADAPSITAQSNGRAMSRLELDRLILLRLE